MRGRKKERLATSLGRTLAGVWLLVDVDVTGCLSSPSADLHDFSDGEAFFEVISGTTMSKSFPGVGWIDV